MTAEKQMPLSLEDAKRALDDDRIEDADRILADLKREGQDDFWVFFFLAVTKARQGRVDEALSIYDGLLESADEDHRSVLCYVSAEAALNDRRPVTALEYFRMIDPERHEIRMTSRLAWWTVREMLDTPGFPPSLFSLDEALLVYCRPDHPGLAD